MLWSSFSLFLIETTTKKISPFPLRQRKMGNKALATAYYEQKVSSYYISFGFVLKWGLDSGKTLLSFQHHKQTFSLPMQCSDVQRNHNKKAFFRTLQCNSSYSSHHESKLWKDWDRRIVSSSRIHKWSPGHLGLPRDLVSKNTQEQNKFHFFLLYRH